MNFTMLRNGREQPDTAYYNALSEDYETYDEPYVVAMALLCAPKSAIPLATAKDLPLAAQAAHAEVAEVDEDRDDGQMEGLAGSVLSYARMALCGVCE